MWCWNWNWDIKMCQVTVFLINNVHFFLLANNCLCIWYFLILSCACL